MPAKSLPSRPDIEQYRKQAKDLLKLLRQGDPDSLERLKSAHPKRLEETASQRRWTLADAQLVIAREHGQPTWADFTHEVA